MTVQLLLFPPSSAFFDRAIARLEGSRSDVIHAAVLCGDYYIESVEPMVRMMPAERLPENVQRTNLSLTPQQETSLISYLRSRVGTTHYSIQAIGIDLIGLTTHHWLSTSHRHADCSGLVAESLVSIGAVSTLPRDPGTITPEDLAVWVSRGMPQDLGSLLSPESSVTTTTITTVTKPGVEVATPDIT